MLNPQLVWVNKYRYGTTHAFLGLPDALYPRDLIKTPEDAAALVTLARAVRRPAAPVQECLTDLFRTRFDEYAFGGGWEDGLHFYVFHVEVLPDTTLIWWCVLMLGDFLD